MCHVNTEFVALSPTQANELLQSSKQIQNKADKERTLRESLRLYQQISQHTDLPLVCSQYRQGRDTQDNTFCICVANMLNNAVVYFLLLNFRSAFLRGSPWVVPHSSGQERSTETGAPLLQERRARGGRSGTAGLPGKVKKVERRSTQICIIDGHCSQLSQTCITPSLSAPDFRVISASQTPCRSWWTRAKPPLSPPASLSSLGLL